MLIRRLYYLKKTGELWENPKVKVLQKNLLKRLISFSRENVPFYKGYPITDNVEELPVIQKSTVRKHWKKFQSDRNVMKSSTTGTTGPQMEIRYDRRGEDYLKAVFLRALLNIGYKPWQRIFYYWPTVEKKAYNKLGFMRKLYVNPSLSVDQQINLLLDKKPEIIYYFSDALYYVAKRMEYLNIKPKKPRIIVTQAEILTKTMRKTIERVFQAKVYDQYAMTEFVNIANQNKRGDYVINEDAFILRVKKGDKLKEFGKGEIVITNLVNYGMPLINYATGDMGKISKGDVFRIIRIFGRKESYQNKKSPSEIVEKLIQNKNIFKFRFLDGKLEYTSFNNNPEEINGKYVKDIKPLEGGKMGFFVNM